MDYFCKQEYIPWQALLRKFGRNPRSQGSESNVKRKLEKKKKKQSEYYQIDSYFRVESNGQCTIQEFRCDR